MREEDSGEKLLLLLSFFRFFLTYQNSRYLYLQLSLQEWWSSVYLWIEKRFAESASGHHGSACSVCVCTPRQQREKESKIINRESQYVSTERWMDLSYSALGSPIHIPAYTFSLCEEEKNQKKRMRVYYLLLFLRIITIFYANTPHGVRTPPPADGKKRHLLLAGHPTYLDAKKSLLL